MSNEQLINKIVKQVDSDAAQRRPELRNPILFAKEVAHRCLAEAQIAAVNVNEEQDHEQT